MQLHAIAGLPRAGSTLLCNILNQRQDTAATSTSCLPGFVRAMGGVASSRIEFKNLLNIDLAGTQKRYETAVRAFCHEWHRAHGKPIVFDKSRAWNVCAGAFRDIEPTGKIIACVRDLRDVFASVEREERKNGLISVAPLTMKDRYREAFAPDGVIGGPYRAVLNMLDTDPDNVLVIRYEDLVTVPADTMKLIEQICGLEPFAYDFDNVPDTAIDPDGFYLGKFPHRASGKVDPNACQHWSGVVSNEIAADIMAGARRYNSNFEYRGKSKAMDDRTPAPSGSGSGDPTDAEIDVCNYV